LTRFESIVELVNTAEFHDALASELLPACPVGQNADPDRQDGKQHQEYAQ
jgi:hypothetical protein